MSGAVPQSNVAEVPAAAVAPVSSPAVVPSTVAPEQPKSVVNGGHAQSPTSTPAKPVEKKATSAQPSFSYDTTTLNRTDEADLGNGTHMVRHRCMDTTCKTMIASVTKGGEAALWVATSANGKNFTVNQQVEVGKLATNQFLNSGNAFKSNADFSQIDCGTEFAALYNVESRSLGVEQAWQFVDGKLVEKSPTDLTMLDTCEG